MFVLRSHTWHWTQDDCISLGYYDDNQLFGTFEEALQERNKRLIEWIRKHGVSSNLHSHKSPMEQQIDLYRYLNHKFHLECAWLLYKIGFDVTDVLSEILKDDNNAIEICEVLGMDIMYKIVPFDTNDFLYKLERNPNFTDFLIPEYHINDFLIEDYLFAQQCYAIRYFDTLEEVQNQLAIFFCYELYRHHLSGTFSELSDAPDILNIYIQNNPELLYDSERRLLTIAKCIFPEEFLGLVKGLIALLKPHKIPLLLKPHAVQDIETLSKEHEQKWQEHMNYLRKTYNVLLHEDDFFLEDLEEKLNYIYELDGVDFPFDFFFDGK